MRCSRAFCGIIAEALRVELWASAGKPDFTAVERAVKRGKLRAGLWASEGKPDFTVVRRAVKKG